MYSQKQEMQNQLITVTNSPYQSKPTASHKVSSIQGNQCSSLFFFIAEIGTYISLLGLLYTIFCIKEKLHESDFKLYMFIGFLCALVLCYFCDLIFHIGNLLEPFTDYDILSHKKLKSLKDFKTDLILTLYEKPKLDIIAKIYSENDVFYMDKHITMPFEFSSWKDISRPVIIDAADLKGKKYLIVEMIEEVDFYDEETFVEANFAREAAHQRLLNDKEKNDYPKSGSIIERKFINYNDEVRIVKLDENSPWFVGKCWFVLFCFFSLGEFYKKYVCSLCYLKTIYFKKIVSSHYDMNSEEVTMKYKRNEPQIKIGADEIKISFTDAEIATMKEDNKIRNQKKDDGFLCC